MTDPNLHRDSRPGKDTGADDSTDRVEKLGRGFSAISRAYYDGPAADDALKAWADKRQTVEERIAEIARLAKKALAQSSLPTEPMLRFQKADVSSWVRHDIKHPLTEGWCFARIEHYVTRVRGYAHDSMEGISARILDRVPLLDSENREVAIGAAIAIGIACTEARYYEWAKSKGDKSRKRARRRGARFRECFVAKRSESGITPAMTCSEVEQLLSIPDNSLAIYIRDERVCVETYEGVESMSLSHFRNEYRKLNPKE